MTKNQSYINIKCEVAEHGIVTKEAMRFYCESRLSKKEFDKAVSVGKTAFDNTINDMWNNGINNSIKKK